MLRPRALALLAASVGGTVTTVVSLPWINPGYRAPSVHVALETAAALIALLAAYLVFGRLQQIGRLNDLMLFAALLLFGLTNLFFAAVPASISTTARFGTFGTWASLFGALLAAGVFALAAFTPKKVIRRPAVHGVATVAAAFGAIAVIAAIVGAIGSRLPAAINPALSPDAAGLVSGEPLLLGAQLTSMVLFLLAAIGFLRWAGSDDRFVGWLAAGAVMGAFARLNYFLFPSLYSDWVSAGDVLRCAFYLLLLVGAAAEIRGYWLKFAENAVLAERQRIAHEIHDGLAQELAFIVVRAKRPGQVTETIEQIGAIAQRALDDSRRAIVALSGPVDEALAKALADTANEVAERTGVSVRLDLQDDIDVPPATREALLRITREALTNAARHGGAHSVQVHLAKNGGMHLEIIDDGAGFDPNTPLHDRNRFGLISMRERARVLGGELLISSRPGAGTKVEVVLPDDGA